MIDSALLDTLEKEIKANGTDDTSIQKIRKKFPDIMIKKDLDDYVIETSPVRECGKFNLYLINVSEECHTLTAHMEGAGGVLVGIVEEDD